MICHFLTAFGLSIALVNICSAQQMFPPSPFGGKGALKLLIENELVYPREALHDSTEGMVNLLFVVDRDGNTGNLKVWQSLSPEADREAVRLFNKVLWHPARVGSMTMASEHYMRVEFDMRKYRKMVIRRGYDTLPAIIVPVDTTEQIWRSEEIDTIATSIIPLAFAGLAEYLADKVEYPTDAFMLSIEGVVELEFVVEQHGGVSNIRALNWVGGGCYQEAVRLCRTTRWIPAIKNGKAVRSYSQITMKFELPTEPVLDH
jgi:TonB family protein